MIKKTLFIGGGLLLLLTLLFGGNALSYVGTMIGQVRENVDDRFVSIEFKLKNARDQIAKLTPEIKHSKTKVAREEVAVERLAIQVRNIENGLALEQKHILRLTDDLESGKSHFTYVGTSYSAKEVETDLQRRFSEFKNKKSTLSSLQKALEARNQGLGAAREKLIAMQNAQEDLRLRVENLQARMQMVEVAEANGAELTFDQSKFAKTRKLIDDLEARIRTAEKVSRVDPKLHNRIPLESEPVTAADSNIREEVSKYFGVDSDTN